MVSGGNALSFISTFLKLVFVDVFNRTTFLYVLTFSFILFERFLICMSRTYTGVFSGMESGPCFPLKPGKC